jgi:hypothetical protein
MEVAWPCSSSALEFKSDRSSNLEPDLCQASAIWLEHWECFENLALIIVNSPNHVTKLVAEPIAVSPIWIRIVNKMTKEKRTVFQVSKDAPIRQSKLH